MHSFMEFPLKKVGGIVHTNFCDGQTGRKQLYIMKIFLPKFKALHIFILEEKKCKIKPITNDL